MPYEIPTEMERDWEWMTSLNIRAVLIVPSDPLIFGWVSRIKQMYFTDNMIKLTTGLITGLAKYWVNEESGTKDI